MSDLLPVSSVRQFLPDYVSLDGCRYWITQQYDERGHDHVNVLTELRDGTRATMSAPSRTAADGILTMQRRCDAVTHDEALLGSDLAYWIAHRLEVFSHATLAEYTANGLPDYRLP